MQDKIPLINKLTLDEAAGLGFKLFQVTKNKGEKFDRWKDYSHQQLVIIRHYDKKGEITNHLDLCYLKSGRGLNIQIPTTGGGLISEDVYQYLGTVLI